MSKGLTNARRIVNETVAQHRDMMFSPYSRFLEGGPTFVTYFSQSREESTHMMGTNMIHSQLGDDSPVVYNRINSFVLYQFKQLNLDLEYKEDTGYETDISSDCIVLPETVVPVAGDLFTVEYLGNEYIFKVDKAVPNIIASNHFYQITYSLYRTDTDISEILKNVYSNFEFIYDNIGTEFKAIIHSEDHDTIGRLDKLMVDLLNYYKEWHYRPYLNCFVDDSTETNYYNKYLVYFFTKHDFLKLIDKALVLTEETDIERDFKRKYNKSIYGVIESRNKDDLKYNLCFLTTNSYKKFSMLSTYKTKYHSMELTEFEQIQVPNGVEYVNFIHPSLFNRIKDIGERKVDKNIINDIIYSFVVKPDYLINNDTINAIAKYYGDQESFDYNTMPIIVYIINYTKNYYMNYKHNSKINLNKGGIDNV